MGVPAGQLTAPVAYQAELMALMDVATVGALAIAKLAGLVTVALLIATATIL